MKSSHPHPSPSNLTVAGKTPELTLTDVCAGLSAAPAVAPTPEQMRVLRFGELITFDSVLAQLPERITRSSAEALVNQTTTTHNRTTALLKLHGHVHDADMLALLGSFWSSCDHIFEYQDQLAPILKSSSAPVREMMDAEENREYDLLPEEVVCYRGARASRLPGICWSLSEKVANSFPFTHRYDVPGRSLLASGLVSKKDIIALKLGREEQEIISFDVRVRRIKRASLRKSHDHFASQDQERNFKAEMTALAAYLPFKSDAVLSPVMGARVLKHLLDGAASLAKELERNDVDDDRREDLLYIAEILAKADAQSLCEVMAAEDVLAMCA